jgi:DNA repair protein RadC
MAPQPQTIRELRIRYEATDRPLPVGQVSSPAAGADILRPCLETSSVEEVYAVYLTAKNRPIATYQVSRGTTGAAALCPRDVLAPALLCNAAAVIVGHNHPSGDPTPSSEDGDIHRRLVAAGALLGISILDSIIVGDGRYYTFSESAFHSYPVTKSEAA